MSNTYKQLKLAFKTTLLLTGMRLLSLFSCISPAYGGWFKRMLALSYITHELNRHRIFKQMTVDCVNRNVLHLKNIAPLESMSNIAAQIPPMRGDIPEMHRWLSTIDQQEILDPESTDRLAKYMISQLPTSLHYGERLMESDVTNLVRRAMP